MKHAPLTLKAMKQKKYLDLYYEWMELGLPGSGLCNIFGYMQGMDELFDLMRPENDELETSPAWGYWGMDGEGDFENDDNIRNGSDFTPLRQNIVLLMAAMANEL